MESSGNPDAEAEATEQQMPSGDGEANQEQAEGSTPPTEAPAPEGGTSSVNEGEVEQPQPAADSTSDGKGGEPSEQLPTTQDQGRPERPDAEESHDEQHLQETERPATEGSKEGGPGTEGSKEDGPGTEGSREERPGTEGSKEGGPGTEGSREDGPGTEGSREERPGTEGSREDRPGTEGSKEDRPGTEDSREGKPGTEGSKEERPGTEGSREERAADEQRETSGKQKETRVKDKKDKKKEKHKDKKQKKKLKQGGLETVPKLHKHSSKSEPQSRPGGSKQVEAIVLSVFQPFDPDGAGYMDPTVFWEVLQSAELNLQLSPEEVAAIAEVIKPDRSDQIPYGEFASHAADILVSLYQDQPTSEANWVELRTTDGSMVISFNKKTGEARDLVETGVDLFEDIIQDMFQLADVQGKGYVSREEFTQMFQSEQMIAYLTEEDIAQMQQYFDAIPGGQATYADFYTLAKELILKVYRVKDPSESEWCQLNSPRVGLFWFNKFSGETRREIPAGAPSDQREQEIAFLNDAYAQVEAINFELERYKQENRELQNQIAQANEEQETLAAQLYETGHALDEATAEIQSREEEIGQLRVVIAGKEQEIELFTVRVAELDRLHERLAQTEQELQTAREMIATRDSTMTERDTNITELQRTTDTVTDRLQTAMGTIDARDSTISTLKHQLQLEQAKTKEFVKRVPELEGQLSSTAEELNTTRRSMDEKTQALSQARKQLRNARERNMELEKEAEKLSQTHEKLRITECEVQTLKSYLTSKTAIVERHKKDLRESRMKVAELEEKDNRRAVILADVLEKTARQYQQQLTATAPPTAKVTPQPLLSSERPVSAPPFPPVSEPQPTSPSRIETPSEMPRLMKSFTIGKSFPITAPVGVRGAVKPAGKRTKTRSKSVPKLPPIRRPGHQKRGFTFLTSNDLRQQHQVEDTTLTSHNPYNPQCNCELCRMNASFSVPGFRPETGFTGMTAQSGMSGYRSDTDVREVSLSCQIRIGQRVLVSMKKTEYDLEPQQLTGIVKYVGKIDSEYIDNRIYVGVKLDEAVGDTDGLIKGKRYFTCPSKHGKVVRITNVVAVLPNKSVVYKPLQGSITKRSPYTTTQPKKSSSLKVT